MSLTERKICVSIWLKLCDHSADVTMEALEQLKEKYGIYFAKVFQTITADNSSEFGRLSELIRDDVKTYFAHPYSSWKRQRRRESQITDPVLRRPDQWPAVKDSRLQDPGGTV